MSKSSEKISVKEHVMLCVRDMVESLCRRGEKSELALRIVAEDLNISRRKVKAILYRAEYWKISDDEVRRISGLCYDYVDQEASYWVHHNTVKLAQKRDEITARLQECQAQNLPMHGSGAEQRRPPDLTQLSG